MHNYYYSDGYILLYIWNKILFFTDMISFRGFNMADDRKKESRNKKEDRGPKLDFNTENFVDDLLTTIQSKTEEFGKNISDYKTALQRPLSDVLQTDKGIIIKFDLPGVKKDDINLEITEDSVKIMVIFEEESENGKYLQKERSHGHSMRTLTLPFNIDVEKVQAHFKNCILTIELPKIEKEVHKVDIS